MPTGRRCSRRPAASINGQHLERVDDRQQRRESADEAKARASCNHPSAHPGRGPRNIARHGRRQDGWAPPDSPQLDLEFCPYAFMRADHPARGNPRVNVCAKDVFIGLKGAHGEAQVHDRADQAVALRRRRLCHPVAALDHPLEQPGQRLRPADRMRRGARPRPRRRDRDRRLSTSAIRSSTFQRDRRAHSRRAAGFVALVGVQSNQFPRALDLARQFRARGDHGRRSAASMSAAASSMLPELPPDLQGGARCSASPSTPAKARAASRAF